MSGLVGRFQVMAMLQAARATALGCGREEAESFGLNRAIFYAAAKRGFKGTSTKQAGEAATYRDAGGSPVQRTTESATVGNERAYYVRVQGNRVFVMGDDLLTPDQFAQQIAQRFGPAFAAAWREAQDIVGAYPHEVVASKQQFFDHVYKPRRDDLAKKWSALAEGENVSGAATPRG